MLFLSGNKAAGIRAIDTLGNVYVPGVFCGQEGMEIVAGTALLCRVRRGT